jgi:hypothetical protein
MDRTEKMAGRVVEGYRRGDLAGAMAEMRKQVQVLESVGRELRVVKLGVEGLDVHFERELDNVVKAVLSAREGLRAAMGIGRDIMTEREVGFLSSDRNSRIANSE